MQLDFYHATQIINNKTINNKQYTINNIIVYFKILLIQSRYSSIAIEPPNRLFGRSKNVLRKQNRGVFLLTMNRVPTPEAVSNKTIGFRVKSARDSREWTQEQLAQALGFNDRQTISDLETGKRVLKPEELLRLSDIFDLDLDYFLDPFAVAGEARFSWRAATEVPEPTLDSFELKAGRVIGLLRWLRETELGPASPLKQSLRLPERCSFEEVQERAEDLVRKLDLGLIPAERLVDSVERMLDVPVLFIDAPDGGSISGATCHLFDLAVILINRMESEGRRYFDLAHELFHALTWDSMEPDHRESNSIEDRRKDKRLEQLADNFAAALLMPQESLNNLIDLNRITDSTYIAEVATKFHVTSMALGWRLFNLKLIDDTTRASLAYVRTTQQPSMQGFQRFSKSFVIMLANAIDRGRLSARKASKTLSMNPSQLAELFAEHEIAVPFEL